MPTATPAVLYAAKSTQDRHLSIPTQLEDCRAMAEENGWEVVGEYRDEGFSAYRKSRGPGLARAREHAARVATDDTPAMLLAQAPDRFARGAGDSPKAPKALTEIWHEARRDNVHLRTVEEDDDLRSAGRVGNLGDRTHGESKRKGRAVASGVKRRRAKNLYTGGAVFGYLPDGRWTTDAGGESEFDPGAGLRKNPHTAPVVLDIFRRIAAGESQASVARWLNGEGVRPLRSATWRQASISKLLRTHAYRGEVRGPDGEWIDGAHEAIIEAELWDAVHAAVTRAAGQRGRGGGPRPKAGHLLTGRMLRHAVCGEAMIPRSEDAKRDGTVTGTYICSGEKNGLCDGLRVRMANVDEAITGYLARVGIDAEASQRAIAEAVESSRAAAGDELDAARRELTLAAKRLARVRRDYQDGRLEAEDWNEQRRELTAQRDDAAAAVDRLEASEAAAPEAVIPAAVDALALIRTALEAGETDRVRATLQTLFRWFEIDAVPNDEPDRTDQERELIADQEREYTAAGVPAPVRTGRLVILPEPNPDALAGKTPLLVDEDGHPVFRRISLTTNAKGLTM